MDATSLAAELSARQAPIWQLIDPDSTARWVFSDPEAMQPLGDVQLAVEMLERTGGPAYTAPSEEWDRRFAFALAGSAIRLAVPKAARTAGEHWLLSHPGKDETHLRLSVGRSWVLSLNWAPDFFVGGVRISRSCIEQALATGALSGDEMAQHGIERKEDEVRALAHDAVCYDCPDGEALAWFLFHPAVVLATRMMNVRLMANGGFTWQSAYRPDIVAEAWAAAEWLLIDGDLPASSKGPAFHRPYSGRAARGIFPTQQATNPEAHERAVAEHHELSQRLVDYLARAGMGAGLRDDVPVDLAWNDRSGGRMIAEIKSCFDGSDAQQLRSGLGQLLEYRQRLADAGVFATGVLLVSHVEEPLWYAVCESVAITLIAADNPDDWAVLTDAPTIAPIHQQVSAEL